MLVLNDIHIGVQRKAGTTPASQEALRNYLFASFQQMLLVSTETHLLINGDLFDQFEVSPRDWIQTYVILSTWCAGQKTLTLVAGNHDWSPKGSRISSFEMLCTVLAEQYGSAWVQVIGIDQYAVVAPSIVALAHCSNQDIFNLKLAEILPKTSEGQSLLLHANYDNNFAAQSDHSLNVSEEQAKAFNDRGVRLIFAHEHQARTLRDGGVVVLGNQWPTSIADCLNNDDKFAHVLGVGIEKIRTWDETGDAGLLQLRWDELGDWTGDERGFVRVSGEATAAQAADVINAIAKFRARSKAFVVSNAVRIDGAVSPEALPDSFEAVKKFDVLEFIRRHVDDDEFVVVQQLAKGLA